MDETRELLEAAKGVRAAVGDHCARSREIIERLDRLLRRVEAGDALAPLLQQADRPLTVELITQSFDDLRFAGARFRYWEALILREEGLSVAEIARLFGVSRQRISKLLASPPASVS